MKDFIYNKLKKRSADIKKTISLLPIIGLILFGLTGCFTHRYMSRGLITKNKSDSAKGTSLLYINKTFARGYIVLHVGNVTWHISDLSIDTVSKIITCQKGAVWAAQEPFIPKDGPKATGKMKKSDKSTILNQVNIFVNEYEEDSQDPDRLRFSLSEITQITVNEPDKGTNVALDIASVAVVIGGALVIGTIVVAVIVAILCNCPYVYTYNGSNYDLTGTFFSGAVYKNLERDDYLPIDGIHAQKGLEFKIINKKNEKQFINMIDLTVIEHSKDLTVLPDRQGKFHTLRTIEPPLSAINDKGISCKEEIAQKDTLNFVFNCDQDSDPLNSITMKFNKTEGANMAKLVVRAKNSMWSGYAYDQICALAGDKYDDWIKRQTKSSAEQLIEGSKKQGVPMLVYLKTKNGWEFVDHFNIAGSVAQRDMLMPIDISKLGSDQIEIKIKTGFKFWDLDFVGLDLSNDEMIKVDHVKPSSALDSIGVDHLNELAKDDTIYMKHYNINDELVLKFNNPFATVQTNKTAFLHAKGYYNRMDKYQGKTHYVALNKIRRPGGFSIFSKQKYNELNGKVSFESKLLK